MPGKVSARSTSRVRGIFRAPKSKRRRARRPRLRKFYRDARQNRVARISREEKARPLPRSGAARHLSAPLHDGHVHPDPLRGGSAPRATTRSHHHVFRLGHVNRADRATHLYPSTLIALGRLTALSSHYYEYDLEASRSRPVVRVVFHRYHDVVASFNVDRCYASEDRSVQLGP